MLTASLNTVHVTLSLHEGVVREPLYRKYLVLLAGNIVSNLKAGMPLIEVSVENYKHYINITTLRN